MRDVLVVAVVALAALWLLWRALRLVRGRGDAHACGGCAGGPPAPRHGAQRRRDVGPRAG